MSSVVISGNTSGAVTLAVPDIAGTNTITLPALTGTVALTSQVPVSGPAFSAYQSSAQTLSGSTSTKIQFQTEEYDTDSAFDSTTNYRFTPQVAGYYTVTAAIQMSAFFTTGSVQIYKNGSNYKNGFSTGASGVTGIFTVSCQVFLNGSTDYIECYGVIGTGQALVASSATTYFQACMVRSA
jgi:hypothetical protein